jgi:BMFP domain-containing protein YqiC
MSVFRSFCDDGPCSLATESPSLRSVLARNLPQFREAEMRSPLKGLFMTEPRARIFDDIARLMTDAAGVAHGVRREAETAIKTQLERLLASMDVVQREEFEAVREMAALARAENEKLAARLDALEKKLAERP